MTTDNPETRAGIDRLRARSTALAQQLEQARTTRVEARSADGAVIAVAAGGRLVEVTASATNASHDELVASLLEASRQALRGSHELIGEAATQALAADGPAPS